MKTKKHRQKGAWGVIRKPGSLKTETEIKSFIRGLSRKAKIGKRGKFMTVSGDPVIWANIQSIGGRWSRKRNCWMIPIKP